MVDVDRFHHGEVDEPGELTSNSRKTLNSVWCVGFFRQVV